MTYNDDNSPTTRRFANALNRYITDQGTEADRQVAMGTEPWPSDNNLMLEYLVHHAVEIHEAGDFKGAVVWLAAHAWFEGGLDERARTRRA